MNAPAWRMDGGDPSDQVQASPRQLLVSFHFLWSALRRRWKLWLGVGLLGLGLGTAVPLVTPAPSTASATLLLSHPSGSDPTEAMDTDVSLAGTRAVAAMVIRQLHLSISPTDFQRSVTVTTVTSSILELTVAAPTDQAALARTRALTSSFLRFRTQQFRTQATSQIAGYRKRETSLTGQMSALTDQYNSLESTGATGSVHAQDLLNERAQLGSELDAMQQQIQQITLQTEAVIGASHTIDEAAVAPDGSRRRYALDAVSGLIAGLGLGAGFVCFRALTSDRLRRREDVALALGAPVRLSVPSLRARRVVSRPKKRANARGALDVLTNSVAEEVLAAGGRRTQLVLGALDCHEDAIRVAAHAGTRLATRGSRVLLVDLTERGGVRAACAKVRGHDRLDASAIGHFRPQSVPTYAHGPLGSKSWLDPELTDGSPDRVAWNQADAVLVVADLTPAIGLENLHSWAGRILLLVAAGRTSAERMRTVGELVAVSDMRLTAVLMAGTDPYDESTGMPAEPLRTIAPGAKP